MASSPRALRKRSMTGPASIGSGIAWDLADHHDDLRAGPLLDTQKLEELARAELPDFVDDDDAVAIERVHWPPSTRLIKAATAARSSMPAACQIAGLPPGERYAEDVWRPSSFQASTKRKRGKGGASAGARDADRDTEAAASGELRHHPARCAPRHLRGGGIDRRMARQGRRWPHRSDQSGRQRGREISRCRFGEADELTLPGRHAGRSSHSSAPCRARRSALGPEKRHARRPPSCDARRKLC